GDLVRGGVGTGMHVVPRPGDDDARGDDDEPGQAGGRAGVDDLPPFGRRLLDGLGFLPVGHTACHLLGEALDLSAAGRVGYGVEVPAVAVERRDAVTHETMGL